MKIHFLDVGKTQFGDCILIEHDGRFILVDGAHKGDYDPDTGEGLIPEQLERLMGGPPPFVPDLLIITHVHGDHIGCLPEMVRNQDLKPRKVLAAHERWGAGMIEETDADPLAAADETTRLIAEAMQEEDAARIQNEEEARAFIARFDSQEERYRQMLTRFPKAIVTRFGSDSVAALENEFKAFDLKFLGPTVEHLKACAAFIAEEKRKAARDSNSTLFEAAAIDPGARFWAALVASRQESWAAALADSKPAPGPGKNNQSIVFTVGRGAKKVLLAGDMQFGKPNVPGLEASMQRLLETVAAAGPYHLVKTTHHTAHNGFMARELDALGGDPILVHTGGLNDNSHPAHDILVMLKNRLAPQRFLRTDRNGLITADFSGAEPVVKPARGRWNNFEQNVEEDNRRRGGRRSDEKNLFVSSTDQSGVVVERTDGDVVEIVARIPRSVSRVTITVDIPPDGPSAGNLP